MKLEHETHEKHPFDLDPSPPAPKANRWRRGLCILLGATIGFQCVVRWSSLLDDLVPSPAGSYKSIKCPAQPAPLNPATRLEWTDETRAKSIELFQAAVRIPTQSYDDNGEPGEDPRWEPFYKFQEWLEGAFPTAWKAADVEFVNSGWMRSWHSSH